MLGPRETETKRPVPATLSELLREAQEVVLQCRASPGTGTGSGMYDELMIPPLQRSLDQILDDSARLSAATLPITGRG